ncbi:MAG: Mrp/NBP35 family ATP-binding protein [Desulfurococcaceae archaeon]
MSKELKSLHSTSVGESFTLIGKARQKLSRVKHRIMVLSGKGGVGKTFLSTMLSLELARRSYRVGLFDADIHGSSTSVMLGLQQLRLYADDEGVRPIEGPLGLKIVSMNFMVESLDTPIIWRGPLKSRAIMELFSMINWGDLDYLIMDMPPGTGDEAITIAQVVGDIDGAIVVTAPGLMNEVVVSRAIKFTKSSGIPLLGIVENMCYYRCPHTGVLHYPLGRSTGEYLAKKYNSRLLARIPLDPNIEEALARGRQFILEYPDSEASKAIAELATAIVSLVEKPTNALM